MVAVLGNFSVLVEFFFTWGERRKGRRDERREKREKREKKEDDTHRNFNYLDNSIDKQDLSLKAFVKIASLLKQSQR